MKRNLLALSSVLLGLTFIVIIVGSYVIVAQTPITGEWRTETWSDKEGKTEKSEKPEKKEDDGKIHLSFKRSSGRNHENNFGSSFSFEDLKGLTREQTQNGRVNFRLVREAGTVECEGTFVNGKGSGTFRFTPDSGYLNAMRNRGFDFEKAADKNDDGVEGKLLSAALINVTTALADDLKSVGFGNLDVEDLFKAAIFKVDSKFMAEMKATGFPNLNMEDLVKARIFKIDAEFVRKVHEMGFTPDGFESMVKFSIFKVTPEYLAELKAAGFTNLSSEDVVQFRIFKVTPELLTDLKTEGFSNLSAQEVVKFRIFNIDREFIRSAKAENPNVTVEELVQRKIGVRRTRGTE